MALAEAPVATTYAVAAASLAAALKSVEHATGGDDERPILTTVLLSARDGSLYAVAADNYRVAEARIESTGGDPSFLGERTTLLAPMDRPAVVAWLKSVGKYAEVEIRLAHRLLTLAYGNREMTVTLMEGEFPAYRDVLDAHGLPPVVFAINPAYLVDAGKALMPEGNVLAIRAASALSPVFFMRDGYREIVMPVRTAEPYPVGELPRS